jgi:hypothetical protein
MSVMRGYIGGLQFFFSAFFSDRPEAPSISEYVRKMSALIGPVAVTILKRGIDEYNRKIGSALEFDNVGLKGAGEDELIDVYLFLVDYYSLYVGPVAKMLASVGNA